jgi:hypothetical protein
LSGTIKHDSTQTGGTHVEDFKTSTPLREPFTDSVKISGVDGGYELYVIPFAQNNQTGTFTIGTDAAAGLVFGGHSYTAYSGTITVTFHGLDASIPGYLIRGTFDIPFYDHVSAGQYYNIDDGEFVVVY